MTSNTTAVPVQPNFFNTLGKADSEILGCYYPSGKVPDVIEFSAEARSLIPGFKERYESLRTCIEIGQISDAEVTALRQFCDDFFYAWSKLSPLIVARYGAEQITQILELFVTEREMIWNADSYGFWDRLPERIEVVYAGPADQAKAIDTLSWFSDRNLAECFAEQSEDRIVLSAEISKEDLLLVIPSPGIFVPRSSARSNAVRIA